MCFIYHATLCGFLLTHQRAMQALHLLSTLSFQHCRILTHVLSINVNVNVEVYSLQSREFSILYNLHPWYWNSLLYGLTSSGENSAHFLQLMPFTIFPVFVPPDTSGPHAKVANIWYHLQPNIVQLHNINSYSASHDN